MKKIGLLLISFALILSMTSCNFLNKTEETKEKIHIREADTEDEVDEEDTTSEVTEETKPLTEYKRERYNLTDAPFTVEKEVLYNDEKIIVAIEDVAIDVKSGSYVLVFSVGNDTSDTITIGIGDLYVNNALWYYGIASDDNIAFTFATVDPYSENYGFVSFNPTQLAAYNLIDLGLFSMTFVGVTEHNYKFLETDLIDVKTSAYEYMSEPYPDSGVMVGEDDNALIYFQTVYVDKENCSVIIFATNKTDKVMYLMSDDVTVDGVNYGSAGMWETIQPGKSIMKYYELYKNSDIKAANSDNGVDSINLKIGYKFTNKTEFDGLFGPVTATFDDDFVTRFNG